MTDIIVRVNGILIENSKLLLIEQRVSGTRAWAHPGGKPEAGETLEESCIREVKEETGLDVSVEELLYVTERINKDEHVVIISFRIRREGGKLGTGDGHEFKTGKIKGVRMIPFDELEGLGFSREYVNMVKTNFPDNGSYRGNILD